MYHPMSIGVGVENGGRFYRIVLGQVPPGQFESGVESRTGDMRNRFLITFFTLLLRRAHFRDEAQKVEAHHPLVEEYTISCPPNSAWLYNSGSSSRRSSRTA